MATGTKELGRLQPLQFESITFDWDVTDAAGQLERLAVGEALLSPTFVTGTNALRHSWFLKLKWTDKENKEAKRVGLFLAKLHGEAKWIRAEVHLNVMLMQPDGKISREDNFRRSFSPDDPNDWGWAKFFHLEGLKNLKFRVTLTTDHQIFVHSTVGHLASFFNNPKWSDIKLICKGGKLLAAHKLILSNSKFFADKLATNPDREKISVKEFNADVVSKVLQFLYEGQIDVDDQQIVEVIKFAKDTGDQQLHAYCQAKLIGNIAARDKM